MEAKEWEKQAQRNEPPGPNAFGCKDPLNPIDPTLNHKP